MIAVAFEIWTGHLPGYDEVVESIDGFCQAASLFAYSLARCYLLDSQCRSSGFFGLGTCNGLRNFDCGKDCLISYFRLVYVVQNDFQCIGMRDLRQAGQGFVR